MMTTIARGEAVRASRMRRIGFGAAPCAIGLAATMLVGGCTSRASTAAPTGNVNSGAVKNAPPAGHQLAAGPGCGRAELGMLGVLAAGQTASDVQAHGLSVSLAISGPETSTLVALRPGQFGPRVTMADVAPLVSAHVLQSVGTIYAQSADPTLHSCDMQLSDRPAARPYIDAARQAVVARGWATSSVLSSGATITMISDDPFATGSLIVTFDVPGPVNTSAPSEAPTVHTQVSLAVLVDKTTTQVEAAGEGLW